MLALMALCVLLSLAGCSSGSAHPMSFAPHMPEPHPSFLTRVHDDCEAGQAWACQMLNDLARGLRESDGR